MVNYLFFQKGVTKAQIARRKRVSRNFVIHWTRSLEQDFMQDKRGWPSGKRRKWDLKTEQRIERLHQQLMSDPLEFYVGATVILQQWRQEYPRATPPPLRTIGRILVALGLSSVRKRGRRKGAARYLCYPEHTIYERLGGRVLEADFIGRKYLTSQSEPLNFIGFSFKKPPRLRYFQRVEGQTAQAFITTTKDFFKRFEVPAYMKVDNASATIGSASAKRTISQVVAFLLSHQVIPIFAVPRRPFSQASIEGNNSVFARKFWNRREFKDIADVDKQLGWFNQASLRYLEYSPLAIKSSWQSDFVPRVYLIRQVKGDNNTAFIDVLNEKILVPEGYINYFVLAEWNLSNERLQIHFEQDQELRLIKEIAFKINRRSYAKHQKLLVK